MPTTLDNNGDLAVRIVSSNQRPPQLEVASAVDQTLASSDFPFGVRVSNSESAVGTDAVAAASRLSVSSENLAKREPEKEDIILRLPNRTARQIGDTSGQDADYHMISVLGRGPIAMVYEARQANVDRNVAMKILARRGTLHDAELRNKFILEAVITAELDHPGIVPIYDVGVLNDGTLFYTMKRVCGSPWRDRLRRMSLSENLDILMKVADAVAFAHAHNVIHRDIKPENVMVGDFGEVLLMDWGLAVTSDHRKVAGVSPSRSIGGTPAYMAPEMATGPFEMIGPASDIYLLGAILFELMTGQPPHTGKGINECVRAASMNLIAPTEKTGPLLDIAFRAMQTDPEDRYQSVTALQSAVREYQSHQEGFMLGRRAEEDLDAAQLSDNYGDYAQAMFAFQEAIRLWPDNADAHAGLSNCRFSYAESAFNKGDLELASSILDQDNAVHAKLKEIVSLAISKRKARSRRMTQIGRAATSLLLLTAIVVSAWAFRMNLAAQKAANDLQQWQERAIGAEADVKRLTQQVEMLEQ